MIEWIFGLNINVFRRRGGLSKLGELDTGHCQLCRRDFIENTGTGERSAVNVSAFDFIRLDREVSDRWSNEPCPKKRKSSDAEDRLKVT